MGFLSDILKSSLFATVGDIVSREALRLGLEPKIIVIDGKTMRKWIGKLRVRGYRIFTVSNDPGTVNCDAKKVFEECWRSDYKCLIDVEGEEDLLAILALYTAPEGALVIYGQPGRGLVVLISSRASKEKVREVSGVDCGRP